MFPIACHLRAVTAWSSSAARASAPVASGEYAGSLHIKQDTTDRAAVRVGSDVPHALVVEANTGNLARALDAR